MLIAASIAASVSSCAADDADISVPTSSETVVITAVDVSETTSETSQEESDPDDDATGGVHEGEAIDLVMYAMGLKTEDEMQQAMADAKRLCALLNWPIKDGNKSTFAGAGFECMKLPFRGKNGHIAIATNNIKRARWHLERRGFVFDDDSIQQKNGKITAIYLRDEIAGFAFHLLQK